MSAPRLVTAERALKIVAWLLLIALAIVTVGPISWRPISPLPVQLERMLALAVIGFAFGVAYPHRLLWVIALVFTSTIVFEALQLVEPSRHGRFIDLTVKLFGAAVGIGVAWLARRMGRARI